MAVPYIALARPYITLARHIAIYRMHSGGSDQTTNMFAYISNPIHHSELHKKREKGRLRYQQQFIKLVLAFTFTYGESLQLDGVAPQ